MDDKAKVKAPERPDAITDGEAEGIVAGDGATGQFGNWDPPCTACDCTSAYAPLCTCSGHSHTID